jgi:hypothetical protein
MPTSKDGGDIGKDVIDRLAEYRHVETPLFESPRTDGDVSHLAIEHCCRDWRLLDERNEISFVQWQAPTDFGSSTVASVPK